LATVAIESSTRTASVAVAHGTRIATSTLASERAHASDLLPALEKLMEELDTGPASIEAVFVGTGPGSYTGLRVGIATALGLVRGTNAALLGVPSGETLAFSELAPGEECVYLLDARQAELYFARYKRTDDDVEVLHAPCVIKPGELELPGDAPIFGDATVGGAAGLGESDLARLVVDVRPSAEALLALGRAQQMRRGADAPSAVEPLYLRPFAAKMRRR
jgi:tRNA threonylcarbamoyladenosine biosynthesis protein TsaB